MKKTKYVQFNSSDIRCLSANCEWNHTDFLNQNLKVVENLGETDYKSKVPYTMIFFVESEEDEKNGTYYEILTGLPITMADKTINGEKVFYASYSKPKKLTHDEVIEYFSSMSTIARMILALKYKRFYAQAPNSIKDIEDNRQRERERKEAKAYSFVKKSNNK